MCILCLHTHVYFSFELTSGINVGKNGEISRFRKREVQNSEPADPDQFGGDDRIHLGPTEYQATIGRYPWHPKNFLLTDNYSILPHSFAVKDQASLSKPWGSTWEFHQSAESSWLTKITLFWKGRLLFKSKTIPTQNLYLAMWVAI